MKPNIDELIQQAEKAKEGAYVPYSHFHVGAALLCKDGRVYTGANVENASYGVTCCAERVALFKAVTDGARAFDAIAVTSDAEGPTYPCGICRQALIEFSRDMDVICTGTRGERDVKKINELLPCAFTAADMEDGR